MNDCQQCGGWTFNENVCWPCVERHKNRLSRELTRLNETMTQATTTYKVHDGPNAPFTTTDADRAERASRAGARVTAVTR